MIISFSKYHGAGNDFIIIDDRTMSFPSEDAELISRLCHRRFGIGADGLILYRNSEEEDFEMIYYNADGKVGSMCGNGARCIVAWAYRKQLIGKECKFIAFDGDHSATIISDQLVSVSMASKGEMQKMDKAFILDTGSPHYVTLVDKIDEINVTDEGKKIRYSDTFKKEGINVNFVEDNGNHLSMRTYERGVEDETLACGTGTIAVALVAKSELSNWKEKETIAIKALGGNLKVSFQNEKLYLEGPAELVYEGEIDI